MANNQYVNKVEYGGQTLIDLTGDTVTPSSLLNGVTAHARDGSSITGTVVTASPYDSDPEAPGVADPGSSNNYSRGDHVHPLEIFWAVKDSTTFNEITDAVTAGKTVMMRDGSFTYTLIYSTNSQKAFSRSARGEDEVYVDCYYVNTSDEWERVSTSAPRRPSTSTDNAIARYDGTSGALQDSLVTIGDTGHVYFPATAYWGGTSYLINTLGNAKLNLLGLGGAEAVSGRALNVEGYTYHKGAVYFNSAALEDETTFRVDNNADARFRNIYAYRGRLYSYNESSSPSILTSYTIGGSVTDSRDASGTGIVDTLPQTVSFGAFIIRQAATRETYTNNVLQSTEYLRTQLWFRGYGVATSGANAGKIISSYREDYNLPAVDNDLTASKSYNILTTKNTVTVAQGGTGATSFTANSVVMSGSSTTAALTTRAVTNNTSSTALAANTNIPTMNTVKYGLDNRLNRTTAVNAADTGYTTYMARGEAINSSDTNPTVNGAISWTYQ